MAPNFFSKLVANKGGQDGSNSRAPSPDGSTVGNDSRQRAFSSPGKPPNNRLGQNLTVGPQQNRRGVSPSGSTSSQASLLVSVVPPSPRSHSDSFPSTREPSINDGADGHGGGQASNSNEGEQDSRGRRAHTVSLVQGSSPSSIDDLDGLPTPTPNRPYADSFMGRKLTPSSSTGNLKLEHYRSSNDRSRSRSRPSSPNTKKQAENGTQPPPVPSPRQHMNTLPDLRPAGSTISNASAPSDGGDSLATSPTSYTHPRQGIDPQMLVASNAQRDSDTASIKSTVSSSKKRLWQRNQANPPGSNSLPQSSPSKGRPPKRNKAPTGLASAIAASGLSMANATASVSQLTPAAELVRELREEQPKRTRTTSAYSPRSSTENPALTMSPKSSPSLHRPRGDSLSVPVTDMADSDSNYVSSAGSSDEEVDEDDEDEELLRDLNEEDIPVTGFAVASNKRNADFHDLFPSVPEGDYLIEDYGCALQREILIQGRIYISENHICFHANIFGWITDLIVPIFEILALERKMTAFVIPNAIQITTRNAKYTFASFLARDTVYDVIYNIWRLSRPEDIIPDEGGRNGLDGHDLPTIGSVGGLDVTGEVTAHGDGAARVLARKATQCQCGKEGKHFTELAMDVVFPGTVEQIYNLMFASGFMKDFMREGQKLENIQISDWAPASDDPKSLSRNMSYIKPLSGSIGPKSTKCELKDETVHCDFEDNVVMLTTTRTPDVPSGGVFSVKTKTCITWASAVSTRVVVTTQVEWTGRSFIKGIIEKSALDGQKTYHVDLEAAIRGYIKEHQSEFIPAGVDLAAVEAVSPDVSLDKPPGTPTLGSSPALSSAEAQKAREHERSQRSLQWAYDTFEGAYNVAKQSTKGALELISDAWDQSSGSTILWFVIVILVISNIWTVLVMGGKREEAGRRKELKKLEEREKWVQGVVTGIWEEMAAGRIPTSAVPDSPVQPPAHLFEPSSSQEGMSSTGDGPRDLKKEVGEITKALDAIEERMKSIRKSLEDVD